VAHYQNRLEPPEEGPRRLGDLSLLLNSFPFTPEAQELPFAHTGNIPGTSVARSSVYESEGTKLDPDLNRRVVLNIPSFELGVAWAAVAKTRDFQLEARTGGLILSHLEQNQYAMWDYYALVQRQDPRGDIACEASLKVNYPEEDSIPGWLSLSFKVREQDLQKEACAFRIIDSIRAFHKYTQLLGLSDLLDVILKQEGDADLEELLSVGFDSELIPTSVDAESVFKKLIPSNYPISLIYSGRFPSIEFTPHTTIFRIPTLLSADERGGETIYAVQECQLGFDGLRSGIQLDVSHKWSEPPVEGKTRKNQKVNLDVSDDFIRELLEEQLGHSPSSDDIQFVRSFLNSDSEHEITGKFVEFFGRDPEEEEHVKLLALFYEASGDPGAQHIGEIISDFLDSIDSGIEREIRPSFVKGPRHYRGHYVQLELHHGDIIEQSRVDARRMLVNLLFAFRGHLEIPRYLQKLAFKERFQRRL
jgi:hypothetical protein